MKEYIDKDFINHAPIQCPNKPIGFQLVTAFNYYRQNLTESSIERLKSWLSSRDIATISAWRGKITNATQNVPEPSIRRVIDKKSPNGCRYEKVKKTPEGEQILSIEEKKQRNAMMKAYLLSKGYGVTSIKGVYPESQTNDAGETLVDVTKPEETEDSFFVVNLKYDPDFYQDIFRLSEYFQSDIPQTFPARKSKRQFDGNVVQPTEKDEKPNNTPLMEIASSEMESIYSYGFNARRIINEWGKQLSKELGS